MRTDIDIIIDLMKEYTITKVNSEIGEQEEVDTTSTSTPSSPSVGSSSTSSGGGSVAYPAVTKWETGLNRGPANQIKLTKWRDIVSPVRGKANTLL